MFAIAKFFKFKYLQVLGVLMLLYFVTFLYLNNFHSSSKSNFDGLSISDFYYRFINGNNYTPIKVNYSLLKIKYNELNNKSDSDFIAKSSLIIRNIPPTPFILGPAKDELGPRYLTNASCARFPTIYNIEFSETIWQVQKQNNWTFYLLGAYLDVRKFKNHEDPSIRIITFIDRVEEHIEPTYCQIWFHNQSEPIIAKVKEYSFIWDKGDGNYIDGELQPYLLNCEMPKNYTGIIPSSVSVVTSPCEHATNNLRVYFDKPEKKESFAVCVKGLFFMDRDYSVRLIEWIEMLKIMGVNKIFLYNLGVHPNVEKVYKYYEEANVLEVLPLTHPEGIPNEPNLRHLFFKTHQGRILMRKWKQERIPGNDCLYRNMYRYEYIAYHDTDEIIIPHNQASNWPELIEGLEKVHNLQGTNPYYSFRDMRFELVDSPDDNKVSNNIPEYLYMLRHTTRSAEAEPPGYCVKSIYRPLDILIIGQHYPKSCVENCRVATVDVKDAYKHHYRSEMYGVNLGNYSTEYQVWKWMDELILNCNKALVDLEFLTV